MQGPEREARIGGAVRVQRQTEQPPPDFASDGGFAQYDGTEDALSGNPAPSVDELLETIDTQDWSGKVSGYQGLEKIFQRPEMRNEIISHATKLVRAFQAHTADTHQKIAMAALGALNTLVNSAVGKQKFEAHLESLMPSLFVALLSAKLPIRTQANEVLGTIRSNFPLISLFTMMVKVAENDNTKVRSPYSPFQISPGTSAFKVKIGSFEFLQTLLPLMPEYLSSVSHMRAIVTVRANEFCRHWLI
jgi:hypothetical protein